MSTERTFEFVGGGSKKFWTIAASGNEVTVRFGRIGTDGQTKVKKHPTPAAAKAEVDSLVREKLAKGYEETKPSAKPAPAKAAPAAKAASSKVAGTAGSFAALAASLLPEEDVGAAQRARQKLGPGWEKQVLKASGIPRLPPSYLDYAEHLRAVGEWIVRREQKRLPRYLEVYIKPDLFTGARKLLPTILDMATNDYDQGDLAAKCRHLIPFGTDSSRSYYCWDPARTDGRGEPAIVLLDNEEELKVSTIAKDLYELLGNFRQKRDADDGA
jgi:predicted DNA-binding WGR domain protein